MKIEVDVPDDKVPDFYILFGAWIADMQIAKGITPISVHPFASAKDNSKDFTSLTDEDAEHIYTDLSGVGKRIIEKLSHNPDVLVTRDELVKDIPNIDAAGFRGALSGIAKISKRYGYTSRPWRWNPEHKTCCMSKAVAEKFAGAVARTVTR